MDDELPRREQPLGPRQVEDIGHRLRPDQVLPRRHLPGDLLLLRAEDEDAGGIRRPAVEPAGIRQGLDRREVALGEGDPLLAPRGAERGVAAAVLLDDHPVAGAQGDVVARVVVEVLEPDPARPAGALHLDLGHVGHDRHPARLGEHPRKPPGRGLDGIDPLARHAPHHRDGGAHARHPAHLDLGVGGLAPQRLGDLLAQHVGGAPRRLDVARIGDEDAALGVHLQFVERGHLLAHPGQEAGVDALPDRHRHPVAGADAVRRHRARPQEVRAEAELGLHARGAGDGGGDGDDAHGAVLLPVSGEDLARSGARARQGAARGERRQGQRRRRPQDAGVEPHA